MLAKYYYANVEDGIKNVCVAHANVASKCGFVIHPLTGHYCECDECKEVRQVILHDGAGNETIIGECLDLDDYEISGVQIGNLHFELDDGQSLSARIQQMEKLAKDKIKKIIEDTELVTGRRLER
jgi:hypothetical protein